MALKGWREQELADKKDARTEQEMVKALSHPVRVEILEALRGRVASPAELSREMDKSLGVISYHAKTLVKYGCVELVATEPRRGTVEHFFAAALRPSPRLQDSPRAPSADPGIATATFDVDEAGWSEIHEIIEKASRLVADAQARSAKRLAGGKGISIVVGLAAFPARTRRAPGDERG
jgi:DNA-binding transcriptional ArsR family regulator